MSFALEDAGYWNSPEQCDAANEIVTLRAQIEKLTKERDIEISRNRPLHSIIKSMEETKSFLLKKSEENKEAVIQLDSERQANATLTEELAALAEQNEKMRETLIAISIAWSSNEIYSQHFFNEALSLQNLASPMLNRIKAEGMRMAAEIVENTDVYTFVHGGRSYDDGGITLSAAATAIRAKADELEQSNG